MRSGFFLVSRQLLEDSRFSFEERGALMDLIGLAAFRQRTTQNGKICRRGEVHASQKWLAERFQWPRKKVARLLRKLEHFNTCAVTTDRRRDGGGTVIRFLNYEKHQSIEAWTKVVPDLSKSGASNDSTNGASNGTSNHIGESELDGASNGTSNSATKRPRSAHQKDIKGAHKKERNERNSLSAPQAAQAEQAGPPAGEREFSELEQRTAPVLEALQLEWSRRHDGVRMPASDCKKLIPKLAERMDEAPNDSIVRAWGLFLDDLKIQIRTLANFLDKMFADFISKAQAPGKPIAAPMPVIVVPTAGPGCALFSEAVRKVTCADVVIDSRDVRDIEAHYDFLGDAGMREEIAEFLSGTKSPKSYALKQFLNDRNGEFLRRRAGAAS